MTPTTAARAATPPLQDPSAADVAPLEPAANDGPPGAAVGHPGPGGRWEAVRQCVHDLRNPVGAVGMAVAMLRAPLEELAGGVPAPSRALVASALEALADSADQLRHLLDHLQAQVPADISPPRGAPRVEAPAAPRPLVELQPLLRKLEILVVTRSATPALVSAACPEQVQVRGEAGELLRALINLVENGVQAASRARPGAGPYTVEVDVLRRGERVHLEVWDEGEGMPQAVRDYLEGTTPTPPQDPHGHGLGLSVVRRVAQEHGGRVEVARLRGRTRVRLDLPAA